MTTKHIRIVGLCLALLVFLLVSCDQTPSLPSLPSAPAPDESVGQTGAETTSDPTPTLIGSLLTSADPAATATVAAPPATASPIPSPTPEIIVLRTAADFGDERNPLTGEKIENPEDLNRRPLAIKISNAPAQWVRPQSGFNNSDLVFEHVTEAGITRFTMIVYGQTPPDVGPIRSARLIDLELPAMYDASLVYSGSSDGVRQKLLNSDFRPRILFGTEPGYYRTGEDKPYEHTLYAKPELLWETLTERGYNGRPEFDTYMAFGNVPPEGGQPAGVATVDYDWTLIEWKYDPTLEKYQRWTDGEPHLDANTGEQVAASNVIVLLANHLEDPNICEQVFNGVCAYYSVQPQIFGSGPGTLMRDGQSYDITWHRENRYDMFTFTGQDGEPIPLQIGNTWFEVMPIWYVNPLVVTP